MVDWAPPVRRSPFLAAEPCHADWRKDHRFGTRAVHRFALTAACGMVSAVASQALVQNRESGFVQPEDALIVLVLP